ncbi:MAG: D-aminoacyl-tRNA deacylase [Anaerolineae bacterium]|jgi:D-tyrosyl-tRNA(Tyr) deacylase
MRALVQRVRQASVTVDGSVVGAIGNGVAVLVGVTSGDTEKEAEWLARKIAGLRIFEDFDGRMNVGLLDARGEALVVSQFTLYADASKGRRPSFVDAAPPEVAEPLVGHFVKTLRGHGVPVEEGVFGATMTVEIHNEGPVTIMLER